MPSFKKKKKEKKTIIKTKVYNYVLVIKFCNFLKIKYTTYDFLGDLIYEHISIEIYIVFRLQIDLL